jgi:regulator of cell morphogenesis and NO signaling
LEGKDILEEYMADITKEMSINQVIAKYPKTVGVFNQFNIDSCCGGHESLEIAVKKNNVDINKLIESLKESAEGK